MNLITSVPAVLLFAVWVDGASAAPISDADIIAVDSVDWAQVDLFFGLNRDDLNSVCPAGNCTDGGMLNGHDMTHWIWAGTEKLNELFNHYIGSAQMGPGPDDFMEPGSTFAPAFYADGWRVTQNTFGVASRETVGAIADDNINVGILGQFVDQSWAYTNFSGLLGPDNPNPVGAWFYRDSGAHVPIPATISLFGVALAGLRWTRRKKT